MKEDTASNQSLRAAGRTAGRVIGPLLLFVLVTPAAFEVAALSSSILSILVFFVAFIGLLLVGACFASAVTLLVTDFMGMGASSKNLLHAWMLRFSIGALYVSLAWLALVMFSFLLRLTSGA